jgi:hypothetical protein
MTKVSQEIAESTTQIPAWCPNCEEASGTKYPYPLPGHVIGCQSCGSIWTKEQLIEIQRKREKKCRNAAND